MAKRKIVFIIVEGPSDDDSLGLFFDEFYDEFNVEVKVMHYDVTTTNGVNQTNILSTIADIIKGFAANNHLNSSHFSEIIHIVDTDGVFIPNDKIEEETVGSIIYHENRIVCKNKDSIIKRNAQKRKNIDKLINCGTIWRNIPYKIYYMSTNLEHVLHNIQNATDDEKEKLAHSFSKRYKNNLNGFISFICESTFSVCNEYNDSWDFIKKDLNSLKRYTNIGLCFKK